ncbi:hypothetical protein [Streptococcus suis]|uniref:Lipoprotein n=2 Tax=Streptococcus suis TaxID=1307 RepID=D5AHV6_STRGZ|nr:hypothetical protein [Streptococcus suis]ADE31421.1 hypothetical protein SSGZ1_0964 [Streptococcus suis GZ1]AGL47785.1 hypothetical protein TL13_0855 [Streptococcus suis TL13]ANC99729.1 hypothetical protein A6M16_04190 [Streptococcus suis]AOM74449.1 hypothetical protein BFP66_04080 [Streptococcus suis]MBL6514490.1 hypothetical protein [Streptococcus suis]
MSFINQFKSQSKTALAAVAISAATLCFAGGMSISKSSTGVSTQSQASLAQNNSAATNGQGAPQGMPPGQGTSPHDATSGATQSNSSTSSDEVNALKEKNQEIKAQISGDSSSSNQ